MNIIKFAVLATIYGLSLNAKAVDSKRVIDIGMNISSAPTSFVANLMACLNSDRDGYSGITADSCSDALILAPISTSTLLLLKEEIVQEVQPDAYNFLAGEEISLVLEETIQNLREKSPELTDMSDLEIAALLIYVK